MTAQRQLRAWRQRPRRQLQLIGKAAQKVVRQDQHIVAPLAQRRQVDLHHVESIVKILAKATGADLCRQIAMGRRQHPHIDRLGAIVTHARHRPLLQHSQQLYLQPHRHLADLVQKHGAAAGHLKASKLRSHRARKCPAHMTKQL